MNNKRLENAVIIDGKVYELIDDGEGPDAGSECNRCALRELCGDPICVTLFDSINAGGKRFEEVND